MILLREKCTSSRSRDRHGLFFMNKQRMCVWALTGKVGMGHKVNSEGLIICCFLPQVMESELESVKSQYDLVCTELTDRTKDLTDTVSYLLLVETVKLYFNHY